LLDEIEHLTGRVVGQIGKICVLQRQFQQRTLQPLHQRLHVGTGHEIRARPLEQPRGGVQNLPVVRCQAPGIAPRRSDARVELLGQ
jgi:hypothetical protein